jgi:hypothetical protein
MAATIQNPDWTFLTASLERFDIKRYFDHLLIKQSRLANRTQSPDFKWSGYPMVGTGIRCNPNTARGSVFGGVLYLKTGPEIGCQKSIKNGHKFV